MTVETMPAPMNNMVRMQSAMSQCSMRSSTVKRIEKPCSRLGSRRRSGVVLRLRRATII